MKTKKLLLLINIIFILSILLIKCSVNKPYVIVIEEKDPILKTIEEKDSVRIYETDTIAE